MLSINSIKYINSLRLKKNRIKENSYIIEGTKIVHEFILSNKDLIKRIYSLDSFELSAEDSLPVEIVTERELKKISSLSTPNKVLAIVKMIEPVIPEQITGWSVFLDEIQDPGNMGTILRLADWFGLQAVFINKGCVDPYNSKVVQASMGAVFRTNIINLEFGALKDRFPDSLFIGADMDGENIYKTSLPSSGIIMIGNEGRGLSDEIVSGASKIISIPRPKSSKGVESLNAAVSAGIIIAEIVNR